MLRTWNSMGTWFIRGRHKVLEISVHDHRISISMGIAAIIIQISTISSTKVQVQDLVQIRLQVIIIIITTRLKGQAKLMIL